MKIVSKGFLLFSPKKSLRPLGYCPHPPLDCVFEGCYHPGGSFIYKYHATSIWCKTNVQSTNFSHTLIDIVYKKKGRDKQTFQSEKVLADSEFWICDLPTQIFFALHPHLPYRIWPFSWLRAVGPHSTPGDVQAAVTSKLSIWQSRISPSLYTLK